MWGGEATGLETPKVSRAGILYNHTVKAWEGCACVVDTVGRTISDADGGQTEIAGSVCGGAENGTARPPSGEPGGRAVSRVPGRAEGVPAPEHSGAGHQEESHGQPFSVSFSW